MSFFGRGHIKYKCNHMYTNWSELEDDHHYLSKVPFMNLYDPTVTVPCLNKTQNIESLATATGGLEPV